MNAPLLEVRDLRVEFAAGRHAMRRKRFVALQDVSFDLPAATTVGLVGESGCGKSTLARAILRLIPAAGGRVLWRGEDLLTLSRAALRRRRRDLQIVFQDPLASLDPQMTVGDILGEPLEIFEAALGARERRARTGEMLARVGLEPWMAARYPHEFSGGQCQRIGIARAMMPRPQLLICDEAVSSLDVSIQGQIVNLLSDLQRETGMAMLFISHNLSVVRHVSRQVLVMYLGCLVESAPRDELFAAPLHPFTRALIGAVPRIRPGAQAEAAERLAGEPPPLRSAPSGCVFRSRCTHAAAICAAAPPLQRAAEGHMVACHRLHELPPWTALPK